MNNQEELTPQEEAIMELAKYIELLPGNDYKVVKHISDILGVVWVPGQKPLL